MIRLKAGGRRTRRPDEAAGHRVDGTPFIIATEDGATIRGIEAMISSTFVEPTPPADSAIPTVVLSHCWTGRRQIWDPVISRLGRTLAPTGVNGVRVVAYDHRGHGESTTGRSAPSIERLGEDLSLVLDHLDIGQALVVGHSLGGATALNRGVSDDDRVVGLVIVASSAAFIVPRPMARFSGWAPRLLAGERVAKRANGRLGKALVRPSLGFRPSKTAFAQTLASYRNTPPKVIGDQLAAIIDSDQRHQLPRITVPTTVMVGTADLLTPPFHARTIRRLVPGARLRKLPGAGHMLPLERPVEVAAEIDRMTALLATPSTSVIA